MILSFLMLLPTLLSKIRARFPGLDSASIRQGLRHAFSTGTSPESTTLNEKELALITKLIAVVQKRRLAIPASMFLECMQPLNYIGSQAMAFFRPFLTFFFTPAEYDLFQGILEKRDGIKRIIEELEKG
ncbi:MAG: hypothetical protein AAB067_04800 [Planctomycetota bacterium]